MGLLIRHTQEVDHPANPAFFYLEGKTVSVWRRLSVQMLSFYIYVKFLYQRVSETNKDKDGAT